MTPAKTSRGRAAVKILIPVLLIVLLLSGCSVQLSKKTCNSLQGVAEIIMTDRQAGMSKQEAVTKLANFTSGRPEAKSFAEVASQIIDAAYNEPVGATDAAKAKILSAFVSNIYNKCLAGELNPTYTPIPRLAPAVH